MVAKAEQDDLQSGFQVTELVADSSIPDHLPVEVLDSILPVADLEDQVGSLASRSCRQVSTGNEMIRAYGVPSEQNNGIVTLFMR